MFIVTVEHITNIKNDFITIVYNGYHHTYSIYYKNNVIGKGYIGINDAMVMVPRKLRDCLNMTSNFFIISKRK